MDLSSLFPTSNRRQRAWTRVFGESKNQKPKPRKDMESPFTGSGSIDFNNYFYQQLMDCQWKRLWVVAILKYIHHHVQNLEPPVQPIYSEEVLIHACNLIWPIKEGLRHLALDLVYQAWYNLLTKYHMDIPCWQPDDIKFITQITSADIVTEQILEEIVSFRRQSCIFTYELLGLSHEDVGEIFGWTREGLRQSEWVSINVVDGPER